MHILAVVTERLGRRNGLGGEAIELSFVIQDCFFLYFKTFDETFPRLLVAVPTYRRLWLKQRPLVSKANDPSWCVAARCIGTFITSVL